MPGDPPELFIGLMSGTSLDGVDGVLVDFSTDRPNVLGHAAVGFDAGFRAELLALNSPGDNELHRAALAGNALARVYAQVARRLLESSGRIKDAVQRQIVAIGAHGQTVRHRPGEFDATGYSLQLVNAALLAELTGIRVACDFRSRDVAAGGQGAPLVPAFHRRLFAQADADVAVLNLGGIANLSLLAKDGGVLGFDCGPGNALLDHWCERHRGQSFDADGAWGASGRVVDSLLERLLRQEPYFDRAPPKSTGRDLFNERWLNERLAAFGDESAAPVDVQATLAELTARAVVQSLFRYGKSSKKLIVCGGGALNGDLMRRLEALLPGMPVESSEKYGLPPLQVEATAFAWLAQQLVENRPTELAAVTGARGNRVLGCLYPA